jgi:hypothetical protein
MASGITVLTSAILAWSLMATDGIGQERWQPIENRADCAVWDRHTVLNATVSWTGACANGRAEGNGTLVWRYLKGEKWLEERYAGTMQNGKQHGRGVLLFGNGGTYSGDWRDGTQHGSGVKIWANGDRYEGDWRNGMDAVFKYGVPTAPGQATDTRVIIATERKTDTAFISGQTAIDMPANGKMDCTTVAVFIHGDRVAPGLATDTRANTRMIKNTDAAFMRGPTAADTKASTGTAQSMGGAF